MTVKERGQHTRGHGGDSGGINHHARTLALATLVSAPPHLARPHFSSPTSIELSH